MSAYINQTNITTGTANFITRQELTQALASISSLSSIATYTPNVMLSTISMPASGSIAAPGSVQATHFNVSTTGQLITSRQSVSGNGYIGLQTSGGSANSYLECAGIQTAVLPGTAGGGQQGIGYAFNGINGITSANTAVPLLNFDGTRFALSNINSLNTTTGGALNASVGNISTLNANTFSTNSLSIINLTTSNINASTITAVSRISTGFLNAGSLTTNSFTANTLAGNSVNVAGTGSNPTYYFAIQSQAFGATPTAALGTSGSSASGRLEAGYLQLTANPGNNGGTSNALFATTSNVGFIQGNTGSSYSIVQYNGTTGVALSNVSSINGNSVNSVGAWVRYTVTNTGAQTVNLTNTPQQVLSFTGIPGTFGGLNSNAINISVPITVTHSGTASFPINFAAWIGGSSTGGLQVNAQYGVVNGSTGGTVTLSGVAVTTGTQNVLNIFAWTDSTVNPTNVSFVQGSGAGRQFFFQQVY